MCKKILITAFLILISTIGLSYAYWGIEFVVANKSKDITFQIGKLEDGDEFDHLTIDDLDNLPFIPKYIINILREVSADLTTTTDPDTHKNIIGILIDKLVKIYYKYANEGLKLLLAGDINGLFDTSKQEYTVSQDTYLIYLIGSGDQIEVVFAHIDKNASHIPNNATALENYLSHTWTGVDQVSTLWTNGVLYTPRHAAVEYDGKKYFNVHDSRYTPPPLEMGAWFCVTPDLEYYPNNPMYPTGYITKRGSDFFIARQTSWGVVPSVNNRWAWEIIPERQPGQTVQQGALIRVLDNGVWRFWRALKTTSDVPSEASAQRGEYREYRNGWIGDFGGYVNRCYYFEHNTYPNNEIVIDGLTPNLNYRYFRSIRAVPAGERPLIVGENQALVVNSAYWVEV